MKLRNLILFSLLPVVFSTPFFGCSSSTSANSSEDFTDPSAQFSGNVSETYSMTTISSPPGFDLKWKETDGIHALSGYHDTVVLVTFWRTSDVGSDTLLQVFDSVVRDLPDSVRILMIDDDNSAARFTNAVNFVAAHHAKSQVLVDSAERTHLRFAGFLDGQLYYTETFVVKPDGNVLTGQNKNGIVLGWSPSYESPRLFFDSVVRAAYH